MNEIVHAEATNDAMLKRTRYADVRWVESNKPGYFGGIGFGQFGRVAYVALPMNHPDCGLDYYDLNAPVHGGLTFADRNVFGWDYAHFNSTGTENVEQDVADALRYFYWRRFRVVRWWEGMSRKLDKWRWRLEYKLRNLYRLWRGRTNG